MAATFGWKRTIACIFAVLNFYRKLTIPAFVLGITRVHTNLLSSPKTLNLHILMHVNKSRCVYDVSPGNVFEIVNTFWWSLLEIMSNLLTLHTPRTCIYSCIANFRPWINSFPKDHVYHQPALCCTGTKCQPDSWKWWKFHACTRAQEPDEDEHWRLAAVSSPVVAQQIHLGQHY